MKTIIVSLLFVGSISISKNAVAEFNTDMDYLDRAQLAINYRNSEALSQLVTEDLKALFWHFRFNIGKDTEILSPLRLTGSQNRPIINIGIRKCFTFVCETGVIDAEITMRPVSGRCHRNWLMEMDLGRSSDNVKLVYSRILIPACYMNNPNNSGGNLTIEGWAVRGVKYESGVKQRTMMRFLKNQLQPLTNAFQERLKEISGTPTTLQIFD
jgi:hypothetical protein